MEIKERTVEIMSTGKELQMEITQNNPSIDGGEEESDHLVTNSSYKELIGTDKREVCQVFICLSQ